MVKRFPTPTGVSHLVKGTSASKHGIVNQPNHGKKIPEKKKKKNLPRNTPKSASAPIDRSQSANLIWLPWIFFLASSLSCWGRSTKRPSFLASKIPVSSKHSRIAPSLYAGPSRWRSCVPGAGMSPSWNASRLPPGKTCADANEVEVLTRCSSKTSLVGDRSTIEELGRGSGIGFFAESFSGCGAAGCE